MADSGGENKRPQYGHGFVNVRVWQRNALDKLKKKTNVHLLIWKDSGQGMNLEIPSTVAGIVLVTHLLGNLEDLPMIIGISRCVLHIYKWKEFHFNSEFLNNFSRYL